MAVTAKTEAAPGVRLALDRTTLLPEARPFVLTILRDGAKLTLTGSLPSAAAKAGMLDMLKKLVPQAVLVDETRFARGAPTNFTAIAEFGLAQLAKLREGALSLSDANVSLGGRAADFAAHAAVLKALAAPPAGSTISKGNAPGDILPPVVKPFTFAAERDGQNLVLSGFVPSEAARKRIMADAAALGLRAEDRLILADGAPGADWVGAASLLVRELGRLESGRAGLADEKAAISGRAAGLVVEQDIRNDLKALPQGFTLVEASIDSRVVRPYRFEARREAGKLMLSGHVPDARAKAELLDFARLFFEGEAIEERLQDGLGEPKDFVGIVKAGLQELSRLAPGAVFSLTDAAASLKGQALFDAARDQVVAGLKQALPTHVQADIAISTQPLPPPIADMRECQISYRDALARGTIHFRSGSAELSEPSRGILDRLALLTLRCAAMRIEIGGHTDTDGNAVSNAELSRRRSETVAIYFVRAGIQADRLEPVGYGQSIPVAPNDTPENKAKNRRIEFIVK